MKKVFLVSLLAFILVLPVIARAGLSDGLVAYYSFNNCDATDDSGNGHDGKIYGNPKCVDGKIGKAFYFDGINDYIEIPSSPDLNVSTAATFSFWVKLYNLTGNSDNDIIINKDSYNNVAYEIGIQDNPGGYSEIPKQNLSFHLGKNRTPNHQSGWTDGGYKIHKNVFEFITLTYSNYKVKIFANGNLVKEYNTSDNILVNNGSLRIGARGEGAIVNSFFNGIIDEVRIYNRALSESEIKELYEQGLNNCSGGGYTEADLQKKYEEGEKEGYNKGFEAGKEYCKKNPSACGITVSSTTDCSSEYQSGYNNGYSKGYEDGKNSCSGTSQENPFLPPTTSSQCATFDFISKTFSVPCFTAGKSTYSLDFKLINANPVQLELTNVKKK